MYQKDQIRIWVALSILLLVGSSYWITGDQAISGKFAIGGLIIWLLLILYLRRKD
jgi:hypothetical protein